MNFDITNEYNKVSYLRDKFYFKYYSSNDFKDFDIFKNKSIDEDSYYNLINKVFGYYFCIDGFQLLVSLYHNQINLTKINLNSLINTIHGYATIHTSKVGLSKLTFNSMKSEIFNFILIVDKRKPLELIHKFILNDIGIKIDYTISNTNELREYLKHYKKIPNIKNIKDIINQQCLYDAFEIEDNSLLIDKLINKHNFKLDNVCIDKICESGNNEEYLVVAIDKKMNICYEQIKMYIEKKYGINSVLNKILKYRFKELE